jgi:hypothetical protein
MALTLISLERGDIHTFIAWFQIDDKYKEAIVTDDNKIEWLRELPVANYADYELFAAIMGKFNPDILFLDRPIPLEGDIDFEELAVKMSEIEKKQREFIKKTS